MLIDFVRPTAANTAPHSEAAAPPVMEGHPSCVAPQAGLPCAAMRSAAEGRARPTPTAPGAGRPAQAARRGTGSGRRRTVQRADGAARHEEPVVRGGPGGADARGQARERRALHQREHGRRLVRVHVGVCDADQPVACAARGRWPPLGGPA